MEPAPKQREAIESWGRGDVCVIAGPGSGKTFVLVERFKWLVEVKGVPVHRILAITFTEKAAANMRRRLVEAFPPSSELRKAIERAYISTIHAFCARLLRENAIEAAVDPEFRVLDQWEADFELRGAIDDALEQEYRVRPNRAREFLVQFGARDVHGSLFGLHQALRAAGLTVAEAARRAMPSSAGAQWQMLREAYDRVALLPASGWSLKQRAALEDVLAVRPRLEELAGVPPDPEHLRLLDQISFNLHQLKRGSQQAGLLKQIRKELALRCRAWLLLEQNAANRQWLVERLSEADRRYRDAKRRAGALDYSDLEECAVRLLAGAGRPVASFSFILMDEFQDTNPLQASLVELLRRDGNFFAVGDINQSIYGFRHADPKVFRDYRERTREGGGHVVELFENFRSRPEVLETVKTIIAGAEGVERQDLTAGKKFPAASGPSVEILAVHAEDSEEALKLEARHVAARIQELGRSYGDFAILLRTTAQVRVFERVLRGRGVPCQVTEGRGFYETREILDLLAFLKVLLNPLDEISLATVLRSPLAGISDDTLFRLAEGRPGRRPRPGGAAPQTILLSSSELVEEEAQKLARFAELLERYRLMRDYAPPDRLLARLLSDTGYEAWLHEQPGAAHMAANVRKLLALAQRFHASGVGGLRGFVERLEALRREEVSEAEAEPPEQTADAVQLMTVHAAKGLEFPVVFLPAINRRTASDRDAVSFHPEIGIGVRWRSPVSGKVEPDAVALQVDEERRANKRDETQRLFYVAMTRAEESLMLSASFGPEIHGGEWAANLRRNLGIDWKCVDNQIHETELRGTLVRLLQTNQDLLPFAAPAPGAAEAPAMTLVERAPPTDQSDTVVPASAVAVFALCPRKYYLSRYLSFEAHRSVAGDGDDMPEPDEMDSSEFGQQVHAVLAGAIPRSSAAPEALKLVANFESSALGRRAAGARRFEQEQDFLLSLEGRLLRGQIDLWFDDGGEIILLDYKTDDVTADEAPRRALEYELQLRLYALAIERMTSVLPGHAVLYFLRPDIAVEVSLTAADLVAARCKVEELFEAQSEVAFPVRPGEHCYHCPHFGGLCPVSVAEAGLNVQEAYSMAPGRDPQNG